MVHVMQQMFIKTNLLRTASNNFGMKSRYFSVDTAALPATVLWLRVHKPDLYLRHAVGGFHTRDSALHADGFDPSS